jgi:hypothetical protein
MFENRVLRIFGPTRKEKTGGGEDCMMRFIIKSLKKILG